MLFADLCSLLFSSFDQALPQHTKQYMEAVTVWILDDGSSHLNNLQDRKGCEGEPLKAEKTNDRLKSGSKCIFFLPGTSLGGYC